MRLNLSDEPITAELLGEALQKTGAGVMVVNGTSMHPTLQMGWRVFVEPVRGEELKVGDIAVFRGTHYLTIHRLVWKEPEAGGWTLVFRGDYNRLRERIPAAAVLGRVNAIEIPARRRGGGRIIALKTDPLARFYRTAYGLAALLRPVLPGRGAPRRPTGRVGRAIEGLARAAFRGAERVLSLLLPDRR